MCRNPIFQSRESLSKNILLENLLKSKYGSRYEERLKVANLSYDSENNEGSSTKRNNIPSIVLENTYVWPKMKRRLRVTNSYYENTITISSINNRLLVIVPSTEYNGTLCTLVEISTFNKATEHIDIEVTGLKRFRINDFRNIVEDVNVIFVTKIEAQPIYVASGDIINDIELNSPDLINEIFEKLRRIENINNEILMTCPHTIVRKLESLYGKQPTLSQNLRTVAKLEHISFYYLNLVKNQEKRAFYNTSNIYERVDW